MKNPSDKPTKMGGSIIDAKKHCVSLRLNQRGSLDHVDEEAQRNGTGGLET
jgi:hypothetical protein